MVSSTFFNIDYLQAGPKNKQCAKILIQNPQLVRVPAIHVLFLSLSAIVNYSILFINIKCSNRFALKNIPSIRTYYIIVGYNFFILSSYVCSFSSSSLCCCC